MYYKRKPGIKKVGIINMQSEYKERFLEQTYDSLYMYGTTPDANVRANDIKNLKHKMTFLVRMP
jgi:hypothetical protein